MSGLLEIVLDITEFQEEIHQKVELKRKVPNNIVSIAYAFLFFKEY